MRRKRATANLFKSTMNRFLNRKKTDEGLAANSDALSALSSPPPVSPGLKKSATSRWKKTKKQPEPKPELNIAAALPASDDFRTSLLMPGLSTRFSMLREQDDPNSMLGKASDDSVLEPRRRSRMLDFGFGTNGLKDIAEVQSINSSIRPPFASDRQGSYGSEDGYGSENESRSVMSRSRPGEGNNLFGGRQKVYMIPKTGVSSSTRLGKVVYEDDVGMSAFQRHKQRERELQLQREQQEQRPSYEEAQNFDFGLGQAEAGGEDDDHHSTPNDSAKDLSHSPSLSSYDKKRSTTSSTARSEARSSTAATSVASQPAASAPLPSATYQPPAPTPPTPAVPSLERSNTRTRRLYEQGLDQHMQEQQTTALTRLNSIQRQRTLNHGKPTPPFLQTARSTGNLHDRAPQNVYASQAQSPPPSAPLAPLTTFGSIRKPHSGPSSPIGSGPQSPLSPPLPDMDEAHVMYQSLEPGDRGKATAMGAFNKPAQAFDEKQYLERQQMLMRSNSSAALKREASTKTVPKTALQQRLGRFEQERERSASNSSARSRSRSAPKQADPLAAKAFNVFQNAANRIQRSGSQPQQYDKSQPPDAHRTFFGNISASDSEEEEDETPRTAQPYGQQGYGSQAYGQSEYGYGSQQNRWQPTMLPSVSEHPAFRAQPLQRPPAPSALMEEDEEDEDVDVQELQPQPLRPTASSQSLRTHALKAAGSPEEDVDSPTLGPSAEPLAGMMHHLRQKSNASSMYPNDEQIPDDEVPDLPNMPIEPKNLDLVHRPGRNTLDTESRVESTYANSNPWDLDEMNDGYYYGEGEERSSISPVDGGRRQSRLASSRAPSRATAQRDRQSEISLAQESDSGSWQTELRKVQHTRDASTATQQERQAFDNELAARRAAIAENMKSIVETDQSRNASPAPSVGGAFKAFGMLRAKSSRESFDSRQNPPQASMKAMKMLGIGGGNNNASSTTLNSQYDRSGFSLEGGRPRANSGSRPPPLPTTLPRALQQSEQDLRRERERDQSRARGDSEASRPDRQQPTGRSPASSSRARSRSNSEATTAGGRSRSRTGPYRDDLQKAMMEGTGSSAYGQPDLSPLVPRELTPRPSPEIAQNQFGQQPRERSNSRAGMSSYFDAKNLQPIQTPVNGRLAPAPAGPSPVTLSPNVYTPAASSRSTPVASPFVQTAAPSFVATPPLSGTNTPVAAAFSHPAMPQAGPRPTGVLRKKTISKSQISEPTLVSSTSNIDTVDLPEGASLKNGMDEPPPLPPLNPKRRGTATRKIFAFGRSDSEESSHNFGRSKTPDPWMSRAPAPDLPYDLARTNRSGSDPRGPGVRKVSSPKKPWESSPAMGQYGFGPSTGSPERVTPERIQRSPVPPQAVGMEGGMF